jgi:hypothetical protein
MRAVSFRIAFLVLWVAACAHAPSGGAPGSAAPAGPPATANDEVLRYFPLAVGNEWTWIDQSPQQPGVAPKRRTVRVLSRDADGYFVDSEKGALRAAHGCIHDRARRILCAPLEDGRGWTSVVSVTSTEHYRIAATGVAVRVPAGSFEDCVVVRARNRAGDDAENVLEIAYAPGVGPVRLETFAEVKGRKIPQVRAELLTYRIERAAR